MWRYCTGLILKKKKKKNGKEIKNSLCSNSNKKIARPGIKEA
jgi:hypothetical protein